ncbi:proto-oncogene tyrosine-protein kinase ros [Lasius niger]|uniref:Proto-oncogene tyrosine-protein kinase ros n=1 Tax=Lasius niger TaxID=67767 RepID=A0A0J7MQK6_LASNI|nr:proto-oncogene tyrosine-protein kinase ros [Lasius niger]
MYDFESIAGRHYIISRKHSKRAYISQGIRGIRWKQPEFTNGNIQKYRVQYWFIDSLKRIQTSVDISPAKILQHKVYDLKPDTMYYFKVQAHNEVGAGPYTKFINVSTTHENSVPLLLVKSWIEMHVLDIDLQIVIVKYIGYRGYGILQFESTYSALEDKIYGNTIFRNLITCNINPSVTEIKPYCPIIAHQFNVQMQNLCIDWVARNLYWIQYEYMDDIYNFMKLDLTLW